MKRSFFGHLLYLLAPDSAAGLSVTGDAELDTAVMGRLGVEMEEPKAKAESGNTETPEAKAAREAAEAKAKIEDEDEKENEDAAAASITERETKVAALVESGKSPEEAEAEVATEEEAAAAVQTPELTPEAQTWVDTQLAAKDEEITTLKQQAEEATTRAEELAEQVKAGPGQPLAIAPIDPLFLVDDPAVLDAEAGKLRNFEAWLLKHWDGVDAVEASADGKTKATPGYTAEEIRARYGQVKELREEILPAAREGIKVRQAHVAQARKAYPELFDNKRPEFKVAENLLKLAPGLKAVVPNIHIVIGDALRGEKIRIAEEKARAAKGKVAVAAKTPPPKVGGKPTGGGATVPAAKPKVEGKGQVIDTAKFSKLMEGGSLGRAALVAALT